MNDTGGGVTAIHDVPGDITRIGFHWMLFFLSVTRRGLLFFLHTENRGVHGFSLSRIFELSNCFLHTENRGDHGASLSRIFELSNCFFTRRVSFSFHTDGHGRSRIFFVPRLVLGPTDQREVIIELSNCFFTRIVAE